MPRARPTGPRLVKFRSVWAVEWWDGASRKRTSTGTEDQTLARQFLADFEAAAEAPLAQLNVAQALDRYIKAREGKILALDRLKDAAVALKAGIGHLRVDQINQSRWDGYAAQRVTRPRPRQKDFKPEPVSTGTLKREFNVLLAALRLAWKDDYLPKPPVLEAPADSAPRDRYLTKAEARKLIDAAKTPHVRLFVMLAIFTGARRSSILSLTWERVDFTTKMIDFQEAGRQLTRKRRSIVPFQGELMKALEEAKGIALTDHVIEFSGKAVPTGLRWSWERLCKNAGLNWQPTPHHIKHSVASWFAMDKVPIDQAADWLATDPATLRRTYRKFDPAYLRSVASTLDL